MVYEIYTCTEVIMATGGIPNVPNQGSDEYNPFTCSPCSRKDLDIGAEVYCLQCEEYLCGTCHSSHNSFAKMAAHTILDRAQMEATGPQPIQPLLKVPCDRHPGQVYNLFCDEHDQVCCPACFPIDHKSCDVRYILDVAKEAIQGPELNAFRRGLNKIVRNLETVKNQRELDMQRLREEKDTEIKKIHSSIQQMILQLEAIETSAVNDVTSKFSELETKVKNDVTKLGAVINTLNTKLDKLEKTNDDAEKFVRMKISEEGIVGARNMLTDIEARLGDEKLEFLIDERVAEFIRKLQSVGQLVYRYALSPESQQRVNIRKDKEVCNIEDICLAEDGSLFMTDWNNDCMKRLDKDYYVIDYMKFKDPPRGMCIVSANKVAVCLGDANKVQLVTLHPTMSKSSSFKTTDCCRGIAYHNDHLYVNCGGGKTDDCSGHVAVYTLSGFLVRKLKKNSEGKLFSSVLLGVAVRSSDGVIFVCDGTNGLVALRADGQRLWTITCKDLELNGVTRVSIDKHGQALVSCRRSSKVVLVSRDGQKLDVVLTGRDGIFNPQGMCFTEKWSHLIVGMEGNNQLSVFKLE